MDYLPKIIDRVKRSPVESVTLCLVIPWMCSSALKRISQQEIGQLLQKPSSLVDEESNDENNEVKYRGKVFQTVASKEKVDLSWLGAIPYWTPICIIGMETIFMIKDGVNYFKRRGYNPGQRHRYQLYFFSCILPISDYFIGEDWSNPTKKQQKNRRLTYRFRLPLYLWVLIEFALTISSFRMALDFNNKLSVDSRIALITQLSVVNGIFGINIAHELLHKKNRFERALAWALLTNVNYCHWFDEHDKGHHEHVATPEDPATARENETVFQFLPRSYIGGFQSSCEIERNRLLKEEGIDHWFTIKNRVLRGLLGSALWALFLSKITRSKWAIPIFYWQGFFASFLLEVINYIEHYGLLRKRDSITGKYEPVDPRHSWNAPNRLSNTILFKLQRHSDHHTFATRPYEILRNFKESPQMPTGYIGMVPLALFPPAFFYVMTPLLKAHRLEYGEDEKNLTEKEERMVRELKALSQKRMTLWTLTTFSLATFGVIKDRL